MAKKKRRDNTPRHLQPGRQQQGQVLQQQQYVEQIWQGPLPDAETLERYNAILPDAADRVFKMAEAQATHRHKLETSSLRWNTFRSYLGLILGFVIVIVVLRFGVDLIRDGYETPGTIVISVDLVSLATAFIYGRSAQGKERLRRFFGR